MDIPSLEQTRDDSVRWTPAPSATLCRRLPAIVERGLMAACHASTSEAQARLSARAIAGVQCASGLSAPESTGYRR